MQTRTVTYLEFDGIERDTIRRVHPSVRIAFPMDDLDRSNSRAWQQWPGRVLWVMTGETRQEWDAASIYKAWDALVTLVAALEEQSTREYWERTLQPRAASIGEPVPAADLMESYKGGAVGLVAPGTDVCGALAESRGAQLREARAALEVLEAAKEAVGPPPEGTVSVKYQGV